MPNWCSNDINIKADKDTMVDILVDAGYDTDTILSFFKGDVIELDSGFYSALIPRPSEDEMASYATGYSPGWYGWSLAHWGVKWDDTGAVASWTEGFANIAVDTAWGPPIEAFVTISKRYPVEIGIVFDEPGMQFCGITIIKGGEILSDDGYSNEDYPEMFDADGEFSNELERIKHERIADLAPAGFEWAAPRW